MNEGQLEIQEGFQIAFLASKDFDHFARRGATMTILKEGNGTELRKFIPEEQRDGFDKAHGNDAHGYLCEVPSEEARMVLSEGLNVDFTISLPVEKGCCLAIILKEYLDGYVRLGATMTILEEGNKTKLRKFIPEEQWDRIDKAHGNDVTICLCEVSEHEARVVEENDGNVNFNPREKL